jgi:succinate dehydrogenase / fumarate reductase flavoprotein subunit
MEYATGSQKTFDASTAGVEVKRQEAFLSSIRGMGGSENPFRLHQELGDVMNASVTVVRYNARLDQALERIGEFRERWRSIGLADHGTTANQSLYFARQLFYMIELAHVIALGARLRDESRGAHYKPDFPNRDDERFLKTTRAKYSREGPRIEFEPVDIQYIAPRVRNYDVDKKEALQ